MSRKPQNLALRGSQKWLQILINHHSQELNKSLRDVLKMSDSTCIEWLSPLLADEYSEYSDQAFLDRLRTQLPKHSLRDFWPARGPVWDGLGLSSQGDLFLVEAKSHIPEMLSSGCQASEPALTLIKKSLNDTRNYTNSTTGINWDGPFYQYANRIAHLYLLRERNGLPAYLVYIYFVNDLEMGGPVTREEWSGAIKLRKSLLDLNRHQLSKFVIDIFVGVGDIKSGSVIPSSLLDVYISDETSK